MKQTGPSDLDRVIFRRGSEYRKFDRMYSQPFWTFTLVFSLIVAIAFVSAEDETETDCLARVGGLKNVLEKEIVHDPPYDENSQLLVSNIPGPFRIDFPGQSLTSDYNPTRITFTVDTNNIVTDAECI